MAFNHVTIEKHTKQNIYIALVFLAVIYFLALFTLWWMIKNVGVNWEFFLEHSGSSRSSSYRSGAEFVLQYITEKELIIVSFLAFFAVFMQFMSSEKQRVVKTLNTLGAFKHNPADSYHSKLDNIVQEASIALGGMPLDTYVIDSTSINAFSLSDGEKWNVVGVTEGALAKLSRAQLEAVVAQCASIIATGDSMVISKSASLLGLIDVFTRTIAESHKGLAAAVFALYNFIFSILNTCMMSFLSSESFLRADANAIRLTNNPQALAQALSIIGNSSAYGLARFEGLEIVFVADLRAHKKGRPSSTHPDLWQRIDFLLKMANLGRYDLMASQTYKINELPVVSDNEFAQDTFMVKNNEEWRGPFIFSDLLRMPWISVETEILNNMTKDISPFGQHPFFQNKAQVPLHVEGQLAEDSCPVCHSDMYETDYEGAKLSRCSSCLGYLVNTVEIKKIMSREERAFTPRILHQAAVLKGHKHSLMQRGPSRDKNLALQCPVCKAKMQRRFFSGFAPVEIDLCHWCGLRWFDSDELELVQVLYENADINEREMRF